MRTQNMYILLLVVSAMICSCGRPARKKMPELALATDGFEQQAMTLAPPPPFQIGDTSIEVDGLKLDFLSVGILDPGNDSLALAMVKSYSPMARQLFDALRASGKKGALIDLRTSAPGQRADFSLAGADNSFHLPLVLLWDEESSGRGAAFLEGVKQMSSFRLEATGSHPNPCGAGSFELPENGITH